MIGLDTNVLVRYLVQDDPAQTRQANALIDRAAAQEKAMFINHVVMCELAWVLGHGYGYARTALAEVCLLYTSPSPRDRQKSRMPSSA